MPRTTHVAVILHILRNQPFGEIILKGIRDVLDERPSCEVEVFDPQGRAEEQVRALEHLKSGLDGLIVSPLDASVGPLLKTLRASGVRVVAVDNDIGDPDAQDALVMADNHSIGATLGLFMKEVMEGVGDIVEIRGIDGCPCHDRAAGFRRAISDQPRMRIIESCAGDWYYDLARESFASVLERHPHIDAVFAQNDEMARGALDAAAAVSREEALLVTGVDAVPGAFGIKLISRGRLAASCLNPPSGKQAALALLAALDGEPFQARTLLPTSILRSNDRIQSWQARRRR